MHKSWNAIEALARLEQRKSMRKGNFVTLIHTPVVQHLSPEDRSAFYSYLRGKNNLKKFLIFFSFFAIVLFLGLRFPYTGSVVLEFSQAYTFSWLFFTAFFGCVSLLIFFFFREREISKIFKGHTDRAE